MTAARNREPLDPAQINFNEESKDQLEFDQIMEIQEEEQNDPTNLKGHFKRNSDMREGGEFLDYDGYQGDGAYLSSSHCNIQADDSYDSDDEGA